MRILSLAFVVSIAVACGSSSGTTDNTTTDSGSGTTADTGGGTCTLGTTCLGAFLGTCFDPSTSCTATASAINFSNGAKMTLSGTTWTATSSKGASCYTVDVTAGGYTFHVGSGNASLVYAGNQARFTCPDGSPINFTASAFDNSECALYVPDGARCSGGKKH